MLWGLPSGSDPDWTAAVQTAGTKNILGFNEPDLTYSGSSNILPANAAAVIVGRDSITLWPHSHVQALAAALGFSPRLANQGGLRSTSIDPP